LVTFLSARFEHLIVSRFLYAFNHEVLADGFLLLGPGTRDAVTFGTGHDTPFFCHVGIIRSFLRRHIVFFAHQFVARLCPISFGKLGRVALVDHGDFSGAFFHFLA
jgi:hypothetical protein